MTTSPDCADGIPEAWIQRLFSRLAATYGNKLAVMWGDCPKDEVLAAWRAGLHGFSGDQIKAGLVRMLDAYPEWPPTLGQFRELCRTPIGHAAHQLYLVDKRPQQPIPADLKASIDSLVQKIRERSSR